MGRSTARLGKKELTIKYFLEEKTGAKSYSRTGCGGRGLGEAVLGKGNRVL